ncbi:MAG TPA: RICIN domain-containing protein [Bryobacteraceae bacterium]|nr:RICIN domain-containing protein [Bryobacteraceae bacterium]
MPRPVPPPNHLIPLSVFLMATFGRLCLAQVNVLTYHNDNARTGQNLAETKLTLSNVNSTGFGKLFQVTLDGKVDAEPLYVSNVNMPQHGVHNVVFAATEHDSLYAFDADSGAIYWHISALKSGETTSDPRGCSQVTPEIGITSTPVIDLSAGAHGTIYLVAMSKDASGNYHQRLHALDVTTGAEEFGGPVDVAASYSGSGDNSVNGSVEFDPKQYKSRPGLLLLNGTVYTAWGSHCDDRPYTGWLIGYNESILQQNAVFNFAPNGNEGALWAAGGGVAADTSGNIFVQVANGTFDTSLNAQGFPSKGDYGNAFVKLSRSGGSGALGANDYWTMDNTVTESDEDEDLGSGGLILFPDVTDASGATRHLGTGAGKDGNVYVFDRDKMGKFLSGSNGSLYQELAHGLAGGEFATPAWFNGTVYYGAVGDTIRAYKLSAARFPGSATNTTGNSFEYPGTTPAISANGASNGILWAVENSNPAVLHAYEANDVAVELYNTNQASGGRDQFGPGNKFITPAIANGRVFVGTTTGVAAFGLLSPHGPIATGDYLVTNEWSGLVLDDPGLSKTSGTQIIEYPANGGANQSWRFAFQSSGYYTIQNVSSQLYLSDPGDAAANDTKLEQLNATSDNTQLWSLVASGNGYVLHNRATGLVVDDPGFSTTKSTGIILYTANGGSNQTWVITSAQ